VLACKLADELVDESGARGVELPGRLVRKEELRPVGERGTHGDALLLAAGELGRPRAPFVGKPDALEQLVGPPLSLVARRPREAQLDAHELPRGQVGVERARVVLLHVTGCPGAVLGQSPRRETREIGIEDLRGAGRGPLEPCEHPEQRRLPGPARSEDDKHLLLLHGQRQTLQRRGVPLRARVDTEEITDFDRAHTALLVERATSPPVSVP
jgi:hypothetical protein